MHGTTVPRWIALLSPQKYPLVESPEPVAGANPVVPDEIQILVPGIQARDEIHEGIAFEFSPILLADRVFCR